MSPSFPGLFCFFLLSNHQKIIKTKQENKANIPAVMDLVVGHRAELIHPSGYYSGPPGDPYYVDIAVHQLRQVWLQLIGKPRHEAIPARQFGHAAGIKRNKHGDLPRDVEKATIDNVPIEVQCLPASDWSKLGITYRPDGGKQDIKLQVPLPSELKPWYFGISKSSILDKLHAIRSPWYNPEKYIAGSLSSPPDFSSPFATTNAADGKDAKTIVERCPLDLGFADLYIDINQVFYFLDFF